MVSETESYFAQSIMAVQSFVETPGRGRVIFQLSTIAEDVFIGAMRVGTGHVY